MQLPRTRDCKRHTARADSLSRLSCTIRYLVVFEHSDQYSSRHSRLTHAAEFTPSCRLLAGVPHRDLTASGCGPRGSRALRCHPLQGRRNVKKQKPFSSCLAPLVLLGCPRGLQIHLMKKHRQVARALIAVDALRADRCLPAGWGCGRQTTARVVELRRARSEAL